ncbi:MAG: hypothetical protein M0Q91_12595 [Methanoregula sp.]|jgi:hypothetical protein|nr:hypothetical protein [Methanoregula sp.]
MENKIDQYESPIELIETDPFNNDNQADIYLSIDWEEETVDVITKYRDGSTAADVWHGLRTLIDLPGSVNARTLKSCIDDIMPHIEEISKGFESVWNGHNWVGQFSDEAEEKLRDLENDIERHPWTYFNELDGAAGVWDAGDWFQNPVEELTSETTDDELQAIAEHYESDAAVDHVVIRGGVDAIERHFRYIRDSMRE